MKSLKAFALMSVSLFAGLSLQAQTATIASGNWNSGSNWSSGVPGNNVATVNNAMNLNTSLNIGNGANYTFNSDVSDASGGAQYDINQSGNSTIDIYSRVEIEGNYDMSGNTPRLFIRTNDTLIIGGDFECTNGPIVTVEPGAVLIIRGDMDIRQNTTLNVDGNVVVEGNVSLRNSSGVAGSGNFESNGSVSFQGSSSIFGSNTPCGSSCEYGSGVGLPIELIEFSAVAIAEDGLNVKWSTATEQINDYFLIEVSEDGKHFVELAKENGAGNSLQRIDYSVSAKVPFNQGQGIYVRLSQFDFDGSSESFEEIFVDLSLKKFESNAKLSAYPNPGTGEQINLKLNGLERGNYQLQLVSLSGKVIQNENVWVNEFASDVQLTNYNGLEKGIYLLRLSNGQQDYIEKYVVN